MESLQPNPAPTDTSPPQSLSSQTLTLTLTPSQNPDPAAQSNLTTADDDISTRRRRRSRWDPPEPESKKRKSRWAEEKPTPAFQLPDFMRDFAVSDPEIQALNARLLEISRILQSERSGIPLDDRPEGARSPSPEPVYDNLGVRVNTREFRARERLNRERQEIIAQIIKRNPNFKPPADYRPPKLYKKLYIPMKEYPGYNFIGLIIGPRGNTQKRMEKETGAKIVIRGKGSIKEGRIGLGQKKDLKFDPAENEDLHVLVEADTNEALEAAAGMVEKLLRPIDEGLNEHKRQQLKELASLNGTIREDESCRLCGEAGHRQFACPSRFSTFKSDVLCKICGDGGHPTIDCPVKGTVGKKMDDEYQSFLAELGGSGPEPGTKPEPLFAIMGSEGDNRKASAHPGLGSVVTKGEKEIDDTNLYIGYLPPTLEDDALIRLFQPYGEITKAKVIKDRDTGLSKGYGFVKYSTVDEAKKAIEGMNGYRLDGRAIAVRVAGMPPQPVAPPRPTMPPSGGNGYVRGPVPWGPPPPPWVSNMYPPQGQHMPPPYNMHYPSVPVSESQEGLAPGVPAQSNGSVSNSSMYTMPPVSQPVYHTQEVPAPGVAAQSNGSVSNSMYVMPPCSQPMYHSPYPSYYVMPPPPPPPQNFTSAPWTYNPPPPPPTPVSSAPPPPDTEYEKFMAEMK